MCAQRSYSWTSSRSATLQRCRACGTRPASHRWTVFGSTPRERSAPSGGPLASVSWAGCGPAGERLDELTVGPLTTLSCPDERRERTLSRMAGDCPWGGEHTCPASGVLGPPPARRGDRRLCSGALPHSARLRPAVTRLGTALTGLSRSVSVLNGDGIPGRRAGVLDVHEGGCLNCDAPRHGAAGALPERDCPETETSSQASSLGF